MTKPPLLMQLPFFPPAVQAAMAQNVKAEAAPFASRQSDKRSFRLRGDDHQRFRPNAYLGRPIIYR